MLVSSWLYLSLQCAQVSRGVNDTLAYIRKSVASMMRKVIVPLLSTGEATCREHYVQFWTLQLKKNSEVLEQVQRRPMNLVKELECQSYEDWLRELGLLSLRKKGIRQSSD